jgi:hypothetical protein
MAGYIQGIFWRGYWGYNQGINRVDVALNLGVDLGGDLGIFGKVYCGGGICHHPHALPMCIP